MGADHSARTPNTSQPVLRRFCNASHRDDSLFAGDKTSRIPLDDPSFCGDLPRLARHHHAAISRMYPLLAYLSAILGVLLGEKKRNTVPDV